MECNKIQEKLSAYIEGILNPEEMALIEEHTKSCDICRESLADLKKTVEYVRNLEEVEPPSWLTQRVMARIREEAETKKGVLQRIFYPLHVKVPIGAVATIAIAITVLYIFRVIQPEVKLAKAPTPSVIARDEILSSKGGSARGGKQSQKYTAPEPPKNEIALPESALSDKTRSLAGAQDDKSEGVRKDKEKLVSEGKDKILAFEERKTMPAKPAEQPGPAKEFEVAGKAKALRAPATVIKQEEVAPHAGVVAKEEKKKEAAPVTPTLKELSKESMIKANIPVRFEDYAVSEIFKGKPAPVDLSSHPKAKLWRTVLQSSAEEGPNFAGHYTIVIWGCGTSCAAFAIVDAITGKVYFPSILTHVSWAGWWEKEYGLKFRTDSRLLIVYGSPNEQEKQGIFFYEWKNNELYLIDSIIK